MEQHILFWIFIGIFAISAAITLLGITNVLKIRDKYLNALFTALILEVVAVVLLLFKNSDYFNPGANLDQLITEAATVTPSTITKNDNGARVDALLYRSRNALPLICIDATAARSLVHVTVSLYAPFAP